MYGPLEYLFVTKFFFFLVVFDFRVYAVLLFYNFSVNKRDYTKSKPLLFYENFGKYGTISIFLRLHVVINCEIGRRDTI